MYKKAGNIIYTLTDFQYPFLNQKTPINAINICASVIAIKTPNDPRLNVNAFR
ncbi:hypothetical protein [Winogradskyella immobilis]|uniref:Uncharacterized protein n=1 Tax=Winogradskyella immobilis TaxID=2816852 RepID=A0ABS8EM19_9FLAO|nr:hypothetical protein [Winogradskyella immobilis]MCC1484259.1 hypothetical protein [Winogradskyella immobilis]MCG0016351.1 hypothetical protein [Winogradskyella immobilis]